MKYLYLILDLSKVQSPLSTILPCASEFGVRFGLFKCREYMSTYSSHSFMALGYHALFLGIY